MQVREIHFKNNICLPGGRFTRDVYGSANKITVDEDRRFVIVDGHEYPYSDVAVLVPEPPTFLCPTCDEAFDDASGLGGHRAAKHGFRKEKKP
jgi:hypothetical protein